MVAGSLENKTNCHFGLNTKWQNHNLLYSNFKRCKIIIF